MKSVIVAMACVICFGSTVNAVAAEDKDATTQEIEMLRREMQQMKASQKALQSKLDALAAAPRLSVAARGDKYRSSEKGPSVALARGCSDPRSTEHHLARYRRGSAGRKDIANRNR
ncbi:hypothetical protein [Bradyrhizobium sp. 6(2017)]|uniref:hypothetical protein n=1 Tax=Bradyrhizobium sp. 6(2017) TaxID=1197460 RepID=UPI0013E123B3|nr:hypothetical protein [Bradyrhizobium sp. 6(2017)]QIG95283.1 hypothetical protein G6P99_24660 [Bradyrhizobium sp. 6(2017)]